MAGGYNRAWRLRHRTSAKVAARGLRLQSRLTPTSTRTAGFLAERP